MKKILSLVLALLMTFSAASIVGAAETAIVDEAVTTTAADDTSRYDEAIAFLTNYGILKGYEDGLPHPEKPIERYQMALFVARISTGWVDDNEWKVWWVGTDATVAEEWYDKDHDTSGFTDLAGTPAENYLGALSYAAQKKIILGYGNGKFGPEDGIRYEDALTMLCRVLEYNNLEWPWGYIEKAVSLGLTKGMPTDIAYRDYLNRGQVAQLIYNALQIECKNGGTLLSRYFNGAIAWQNIVITGVGYGRVTAADVKALGNGDLGEKIAFRTINEDGTLDESKVYFVKNADSFAWSKHYERYLGYAFKAMFTVDEDSNYVTIFNVAPLWQQEIKNEGRLKKVDDSYPIATFLGKVAIKADGKFTIGNGGYLNTVTGKYNPISTPEFILRNALQTPGGTKEVGNNYGVIWDTGDIVTYKKDADGAYVYTTKWYYNPTLKVYFEIKLDAKDEKVIGVNILDEEDIKAIIGDKISTEYTGGLALLNSDTVKKNTAYASLQTFKILGSETENYGLFEEYKLGQFVIGTKKDGDDKDQVSYQVNALNSVGTYFWGLFKGDSKYVNDSIAPQTITAGNGQACWISEDGLEAPESGAYVICSFDQATKELKIVKVINNDKATDAHNYIGYGVVRGYDIGKRAVVINNETFYFDYSELAGNGLLIKDGDSAYEKAVFSSFFRDLFNQYVKYLVVDDKIVYIEKSGTSAQLIVVDSYAGLSSDGYIVINGYKTDDLKYAQFKIGSYNGWVKGDYFYYQDNATADKAFVRGSIYKITSTDNSGTTPIYYVYTVGYNWVYVPAEYETTHQYDPDAKNGKWLLHYIDADGKMVELGAETKMTAPSYYYNAYDIAGSGLKGNAVDYVFASGYRKNTLEGADAAYTKCSGKDTYILVCNPTSNYSTGATGDNGDSYDSFDDYLTGGAWDYAPIVVYTGVPGNDWTVAGFQIDGVGDNTFLIVGVDMLKVNGFDVDQWMINYCLFLGYDYDTGKYDSALQDDWYLLGASTFTAKMFNFYTGSYETRTVVNKDLKFGYSYPVIGDHVVNDRKILHGALNTLVPGSYLWQYEINPANVKHYNFGTGSIEAYAELDADGKLTNTAGIYKDKDAAKVLFDKDLFSKEVVSAVKNLKDKDGNPIQVKGLVNSMKVYLVYADKAGKINDLVKIDDAAALKTKLVGDKIDINTWTDREEFNYWWIMDKDGNVVIYMGAFAFDAYVAPPTPADPVELATAYIAVGGSYGDQNPHAGDERVALKAAAEEPEAEYPGYDTALIKATISGYKGLKADGLTKVAGDTLSSITFEWVGDATETNYNEVDKDDFHFGRYDDETLSLYNAYIQVDDALGTRVYDAKSACITTKTYSNFDHNDASKSDLVKAYTFDLAAFIKDTWTDLELGIDGEHEELTYVTEWCCDLCEEILDDCHLTYLDDSGIVYFNYDLSAAEIEAAIKAINEALLSGDFVASDYKQHEEKADEEAEGEAPAEEEPEEEEEGFDPLAATIKVFFTDSNRVKYNFEIGLYKIPQVKAVTDKFGHTMVVLDKYIYAADFLDDGNNTIMPLYITWEDENPEGIDYYVDTYCFPAYPEFNIEGVNELLSYKYLATYKGINPKAAYSYLDWPYYEIK